MSASEKEMSGALFSSIKQVKKLDEPYKYSAKMSKFVTLETE
jgi:hypothetical protein